MLDVLFVVVKCGDDGIRAISRRYHLHASTAVQQYEVMMSVPAALRATASETE